MTPQIRRLSLCIVLVGVFPFCPHKLHTLCQRDVAFTFTVWFFATIFRNWQSIIIQTVLGVVFGQ